MSPFVELMDDAFAAADRFLLLEARLLERRLFATCFLGQPAAGVADALRGYQNEDGGFGHALEPDKRCQASLPIDVETAFAALGAAGAADHCRQMFMGVARLSHGWHNRPGGVCPYWVRGRTVEREWSA